MQKSDSSEPMVQSGGNTSTTQSPQNVTVTHAVLTAGRIQALSSIGGQQAAIGVLPAGSGFTLPSVSFALPRAISVQSSIGQPGHVSAASLSNTCLVSPQALNIIQRQLSSGIVGLSTVTTQGLQMLQASGSPLTFVTATSPEAAAAALEQQRRTLLQQQGQKLQSSTAMGSSGTIHHMAISSPANPMSNPNQSISLTATMSESQPLPSGLKRSHTAPGAVLITTTLQSPTTPSSVSAISISAKDLKLFTLTQQPSVASTVGSSRIATTSTAAGGPSPKRIKLEEKPAPNKEIENLRQSVCSYKRQKMKDIKAGYREHLTELFYLQGGGNIMEFNTWKKLPSQPLLSFLDVSKLDTDDDDDELQEKRINDEVKVLTSAGSNIPLATPVAISTTLPPSVSALSLQAVNSSTLTTPSLTSTPLLTTTSELQQHLIKIPDVKPSVHAPKTGTSGQTIASKSMKSTSLSPGRSRQQSISSVYENVTGGSQDVIVERAKQEAQVLQRVNELRKEGLWSAKRLPRVQEPPRQKAHWDYLLEEMTWLAADFIQERKWKKAAAKKLAKMVANHFKEQEQKELRAEKEEAIKLKKIASQLAKMVKEFWTNIEKVVQYKQTTRLEEKKKKALDLHLSFIVDQTEKYSSWLTAGLQNTDDSKPASDGEFSIDSGEEFEPLDTASDDEETIELEEIESGVDEDATKKEVEALQMESEIPLEELLKSLPKEMLDEPSSDLVFDYEDSDSEVSLPSKGDEDFTADGDNEEEDVEETIEEQESLEKRDYSHELQDLKNEGEMSVEELMQKYAGAYDSDFEIPEASSDGEDDDDEEESSESEKESEESEEEDMEDKEIENNKDNTTSDSKQEDVGLEFLVKKETASPGEESSTEGPGREFNDIAAAAQSLQPKGYTLETTEVKTKVPFLLKHTLREYQHVGLDWLATMHDKRLNGILADEMGLGKTIQTIAVLAHLACDKGVWGPHLIVVPTSVMLNWEMEFKKWCPAFKILTYYGSIKERKLKRQGWTKTNAFHVCITSYKLVVQDHQAFRRKKWKYFILDEAQNIKNFKSQRWQMLLNFSSQRRLLLTGTPLQNSLMELWSLMHFLMPNVFQSHSEFKEWFSNPLTGMIEGSQEYNENLVRRLHKVLRPFLLRRLKNEVEKQMPQKFEHVVMCRLSKRQRYLYDDFMSQTKTKETLSTGHFMSVINILMQLRKVCNHPDLFDPRPIVSPFKMEGIVYNTASIATRILEYDPLVDIDMHTLFPNLAEMERDLPAFVAQRIKQLKATGKLIQEVDSLPEPPPQPPPGQLKNVKAFMPSVIESGRTSPIVATTPNTQSRPASPLTTVKLSISTAQSTPSTVNSIKLLLPPSSSSSTQQTVLIPNPSGIGPTYILPLSSISSSSSTSAAIAQAKLISSQLQSGILQLVQTSSGHQILTTTTHTSASISSSSTLSMITTTTALPSSLTLSTTAAASTVQPSTSSAGMSLLKCPAMLLQQNQQKPVMRVSPFLMSSPDVSSSVQGTIVSSSVMPVSATTKLSDSSSVKTPRKPMKKSELFLESLYNKKMERRQHILALMSRLNQMRCDASPVCGSDTHQSVNFTCILDSSNSCSSAPNTSVINLESWRNNGYVNCLFAQNRQLNHSHPDIYWRESTHLQQFVHSPVEWLDELKDVLSRFVFVTPSVISPAVSLRVSHPNQSASLQLDWMESRLRPAIVEKSSMLHPVQSRTLVTFPDLRLIQYDCGKLQTLDLLLRQLKSGQHRVLIFTQMTKMLDVLEAFLNFHGHRYLRLDGTTKVEQRQYLMDRFNADPRIFCFILSTRSGGIGVNLTGADTVVFYDSDWNPTMDAQAQDRCHRIGQTRDVHIYRLVSEMTVEENILKKANQKRLLGDLAIEGGNFTTAFFKEQTINDLFAEPSGLESLVEAREREREEKEKAREEKEKARVEKENEEKERKEKEESKKEAAILSQFEQALCKAEDETDAEAATQLQAEQKAELAEFDENIPWDEREAEMRKDDDDISKVEIELAMLDKELTPIERYAVTVMEAQLEPETAEELKMAEEDIENSKKDWELARLKALKEEEERRAELEEDEMLYIYSRNESQMFISDVDGVEMPMWCPPTPPQDDNDVYIDETLCFLYESRVMPEQSLPPVYVPKAHKKPKLESITTRKQKQRKEEQPRVPRSLFDKPKEVVMKQRRDAKMQRLRQNLQVPAKMIAGRTPLSQQQQQQQPPLTPIIAKPEPDPNYPEWLVHEEWALLEAVQNIQKLNPDLLVDNPAQIVNWDFVSDFVSVVGRSFRSAKHCRYQYEYVVLPREDGKIIYNMKQKKTPKSIYKTKNTRPQRTEQLYSQEGLKNFSQLFDIRFAAMMEIGAKRPAAMRQTIVNPAVKPAKHAAILADQGINYDIPMLPSQLAARRAERIAQDKKKQQQQQQQLQQQQAAAAQAQGVAANSAIVEAQAVAQRAIQAGIVTPGVTPTIQGQQLTSVVSVTPTTVITNQMPKVAVGPGLTAVSIARTLGAATGNIIVNAPAGLQSGPFAAINKRMSQAAGLSSTIAVSANLTPAIRGQRPATVGTPTITMQDLEVTVGAAGTSTAITVAAQAAAATRTALQTTVTSSALAAGQKLAAMTATGTAAIQPHLVQAARSLTPHQINILRQNQSIIRTQTATGLQQLRAQKLLTTEQMRAQQLKHPNQKVTMQQLLVPMRGGQSILQGKQGLLRATTKMTEEQLQALRMRSQIQAQPGKQLQTAQIIQGQVTSVGQSAASTSQTPIALVKSVSASPVVTVPVTNQTAGIGVPQQRAIVTSRAATVSQIQQQQRMQLLHQQRKAGTQQKVAGIATGKAGQQIPLLIPQNHKIIGGSHVLHQIGLVNKTPGAIQQIITHNSQPTIITQVSQATGQPITQMVAKVSLTSGSQTLTPGTPITVTHVSSAGNPGIGLSLTGQGAVKTATITSIDSGSASIQVHPVQAGHKSVASLSQSLVTPQTVQVQHTQVSQFLQVTTATSLAHSSTAPLQHTTVTVPASLIATTALRTTPTPPNTVPRPQTPTQISLVSTPAPPPTVSTISTVQVQPTLSSDATLTSQVIAQNVPAPAAMATVVTQTNQPDSTQNTAGQKASPYAMRTRNTKH